MRTRLHEYSKDLGSITVYHSKHARVPSVCRSSTLLSDYMTGKQHVVAHTNEDKHLPHNYTALPPATRICSW
jgi:hypothetical protein